MSSAEQEQFKVVEIEPNYFAIARKRIEEALAMPEQPDLPEMPKPVQEGLPLWRMTFRSGVPGNPGGDTFAPSSPGMWKFYDTYKNML